VRVAVAPIDCSGAIIFIDEGAIPGLGEFRQLHRHHRRPRRSSVTSSHRVIVGIIELARLMGRGEEDQRLFDLRPAAGRTSAPFDPLRCLDLTRLHQS
jgi:hypothetical protein